MNSQELRNLQEAYLKVYEEKGDIKDRDEKASKQKADARMSGTKSITAYQSSAGYISKGEGEQRLNTVKKKINKELEKRKEKVRNRNLTFSRTKGDDALKMGKSPRNQKEETDLYDIILSHLLDEGYAETPEAAEAIMVNMSEEWRENIVEAEVLAQKGGVSGSVKVKPAVSIPGTSIGIGPNRPVPGTFTTTTPGQREKIAAGSPTIDRGTYQQSRVGAGPTSDERQRYNTELIKQGKTTAPRMSR